MDKKLDFRVRAATDADMQAIAEAHRASILEIGPEYYQQDVVEDWGRVRDPEGYRHAFNNDGEVFFVAESKTGDVGYLHGFSSYRYEKGRHVLQALYVRGTSARQGVGKYLMQAVEVYARAANATEIHTEASLSGEAFYTAYGFIEISRHKHVFSPNGVPAEAIMMVKPL